MFKRGDDLALLEQKVPREATEQRRAVLNQEASSGSDARTMEVEQLFRQTKACWTRAQYFTRPTRRSAATYSAPSLPFCCRNTSTTSQAPLAAGSNGGCCYANSIN